MNASVRRASLFTSMVAFGVSTLLVGLGLLVVLIGWVFLLVGPEVESAFFPVLKNFRVLEKQQDGNDVVITASG